MAAERCELARAASRIESLAAAGVAQVPLPGTWEQAGLLPSMQLRAGDRGPCVGRGLKEGLDRLPRCAIAHAS